MDSRHDVATHPKSIAEPPCWPPRSFCRPVAVSEAKSAVVSVSDIVLVRSPHNSCPHPYAHSTHMNLILVPVSQLLQGRLPVAAFFEVFVHQIFGHLERSMQPICRRCKGGHWYLIQCGKAIVVTALYLVGHFFLFTAFSRGTLLLSSLMQLCGSGWSGISCLCPRECG